MRKLLGIVPLALLGAFAIVACARGSQPHEGAIPLQDRKLLESIESTAASQSLTNASDEIATNDRRYIGAALGKTFAPDIVARATRHSSAVFTKGADRLSIHVLEYADADTARSFADLVAQRKAKTLRIEALTYYSYVHAGTALVFFVTDRQSREQLGPVIDDIIRRYHEPG